MAMAHQGMMYTIRKGDNEEPVSHMEIITGRFLLRRVLFSFFGEDEFESQIRLRLYRKNRGNLLLLRLFTRNYYVRKVIPTA